MHEAFIATCLDMGNIMGNSVTTSGTWASWMDDLLSELEMFYIAGSAETQAFAQYTCMPSIRK